MTWQLKRVVDALANEQMVSHRKAKYSLLSCSFQKHLPCKAGVWTHTSGVPPPTGQLSHPEPQPCLWQQGKPCLWVCWKLSCWWLSMAALVSDWQNISPLRHHQEGRRAKPDQWCSAYWQVREQTQLRVLEHKADNYRSPQANETLWLKLYWYIWKINLVIALQLCLIKATAVTWQVLPHHLPSTSHASTLAAFHRSWEPPDSNGAEPCFCWK